MSLPSDVQKGQAFETCNAKAGVLVQSMTFHMRQGGPDRFGALHPLSVLVEASIGPRLVEPFVEWPSPSINPIISMLCVGTVVRDGSVVWRRWVRVPNHTVGWA